MKIIVTPCDKKQTLVELVDSVIAKIKIFFGKSFIVKTTVRDLDIKFSVQSSTDYIRAKKSFDIERSTTNWVFESIGIDDIVFDIGANVGAYSLLIASRFKKNNSTGKVYSFEPSSLSYATLNTNIYLNQLSKHNIAYPIALSSKLSIGEFFMSSFESGTSSNNYGEPVTVGSKFTPSHIQGAISIDLDEFCHLINKIPNHIKLDVDGLELDILIGASKVLRDKNLKTILVEIANSQSQGRIENILNECGFVCVEKELWDCCSDDLYNLLFVRKELNDA